MIVCIDGGLGSGKTYTGVWLAWSEYLAGQSVYTNFDCSFGRRISTWEELTSLRDGVFIWDETHIDMDSRNFSANQAVTPWLTQVRKLRLQLIYISQDISQVDIRVRKLTDVLIRCSAIGGAGVRGTELTVIRLHPEPAEITSQSVLPHDPAIYRLYDTLCVVTPFRGKIPPLEIAFADMLNRSGATLAAPLGLLPFIQDVG